MTFGPQKKKCNYSARFQACDDFRKTSFKQSLKRLSSLNVVLSAGGQVAADTTEDLSAFEGAEAAGDFLLNLGHAKIIFTLVIGEGDERVGHKAEGFGFEVTETIQKIAGLALSSAFSSRV